MSESAGSSSGKYYTVKNNIDASATAGWNSGAGFAPIASFEGMFNGNGRVIRNLTINRPTQDAVGLFANVGWSNTAAPDSAVVENLGLEGCTVMGSNFVGSVVGYNDKGGTVRGCYATGSVTGIFEVGGLVGANDDSSTLSNCYATCSVTGIDRVGGLAGFSGYWKVINCYAAGPVSGQTNVGGLLGWSDGTVSGSYWDTNATGQATSDGSATGKSTAEMKQQASFAGWDFTAVWRITEDVTYPLLRTGVVPSGAGTEADPYQISQLVCCL